MCTSTAVIAVILLILASVVCVELELRMHPPIVPTHVHAALVPPPPVHPAEPFLSEFRAITSTGGHGKHCVKSTDKAVVHTAAATRCCSMDGKTCASKAHNVCFPSKANFLEAWDTCVAHGLRLCTQTELKSGVCCGSGCGYDLVPNWFVEEGWEPPADRSSKPIGHAHKVFDESLTTTPTEQPTAVPSVTPTEVPSAATASSSS